MLEPTANQGAADHSEGAPSEASDWEKYICYCPSGVACEDSNISNFYDYYPLARELDELLQDVVEESLPWYVSRHFEVSALLTRRSSVDFWRFIGATRGVVYKRIITAVIDLLGRPDEVHRESWIRALLREEEMDVSWKFRFVLKE